MLFHALRVSIEWLLFEFTLLLRLLFICQTLQYRPDIFAVFFLSCLSGWHIHKNKVFLTRCRSFMSWLLHLNRRFLSRNYLFDLGLDLISGNATDFIVGLVRCRRWYPDWFMSSIKLKCKILFCLRLSRRFFNRSLLLIITV
jgi:hypothetical protein